MVKKGTSNENNVAHFKDLENRRNSNGNNNGKGKTKSNSKDKENKPIPYKVTPYAKGMSSDNIDKIMQFIEGGAQDDIANKKAQKKARQKQKKEEEKRQREEEEEAERRAERRAEAERLRIEKQLADQQRHKEELALQKALKKKKKQVPVVTQQQNSTGKKGKKGKEQKIVQKIEIREEPELFEQTIPAMVTIKRIIENNNSPPTVTITLKGSTPDQDKLLYTLVNGHDAPIIAPPPKEKNNKQDKQQQVDKQGKADKKKKKNNGNTNGNGNNVNNTTNKSNKNAGKNEQTVQTSEMQIKLSIDKSFCIDVAKHKEKTQAQNNKTLKLQQQQTAEIKENKKQETKNKQNKNTNSNDKHTQRHEKDTQIHSQKDIFDIPMLKLPPDITITKVNGPLTSRKSTSTQSNDYPEQVPVSKSGVIVVDTEKLIQQTSKKKKKKGKKTATESAPPVNSTNVKQSQNQSDKPKASTSASLVTIGNTEGMVTLKNPIFHSLQNKPMPDMLPHMINMNEQATISKAENGMVTIRRPRPVGFYPPNESPGSDFASKPASGSGTASSSSPPTNTNCNNRREPIMTPWQMPDTSISALSEERKIIRPPSPRAVQWPRPEFDGGKLNTASVLQGLPGIQITRVRTGSPAQPETEYVEPPADVSIIRTSTSAYSNDKHKQNWAYSGGSGKP